MRPFDYRRESDPAAAVAAVAADPGAAFLGGGTNLVDHLKLGIAAPTALVDVSRLDTGGVERLPAGGLRIGASLSNADLAAHPAVRSEYPVLASAVLSGASAQIRNLATTAGNLLQRTRCVYFQDATAPCNKRAPGTGCPARDGHDRYNAVFGTSGECVAVHPSDMAVALAALDARVRLLGPEGERTVPVTGLYRDPGAEPQRDTVLGHGELVTAVDVPALPMAARSAYRKVRDRASYAFALVSVAAAIATEDGVVTGARIAFGGLAHGPLRARRAEEALIGAPAVEESFRAAGRAETAGAETGPGTAAKPAMAVGALAAVLRELTSEET
ncbi:xanthine dehydrogenase family protein subunit M [Nocardiopsis sp. CNT-189]|uniref:FAD binding domain-containing protein n=1 Tax=Nocardiopsis oceanisediminis TaxID=2816862 RepID=UPI003B31B432